MGFVGSKYYKDGNLEVSYRAFAVACRHMADHYDAEQKRYNDIVQNNQDVDVNKLARDKDEIEEVLKFVNTQDFEYALDYETHGYIKYRLEGFLTRIKYLLEYQENLEEKRNKKGAK